MICSVDEDAIVGSFVKNMNVISLNLKLKSLKNVNELLLNYYNLQVLQFSDIKAYCESSSQNC